MRGIRTRRNPPAPGSRNSRPSWPDGRGDDPSQNPVGPGPEGLHGRRGPPRARGLDPPHAAPKRGQRTRPSVDRQRTSQSFSGALPPTSRTVAPYPTEQNRNTWQTTLAPDPLQHEAEAGKIAVVPDNARSHHAKALTGLHGPGRLLERITPIHPPPYAPDHNPVEHVRNTAKSNIATIQHETPEETFSASASHITGRTVDHDSEHPHPTKPETILFHDGHNFITRSFSHCPKNTKHSRALRQLTPSGFDDVRAPTTHGHWSTSDRCIQLATLPPRRP
ncbi:transposase [Propionibacterium acidifaciens]|uniref:transposase n=1 Tax=Propionibacterium acidifaciens TaxID=556499 RepID=UPI0039E7578E